MKIILTFYLLIVTSTCFSQKNVSELLNQYNDGSIPYISVEELAMPKTDVILLDTREPIEYKVSRLENAIYVGYNFFDINKITSKIKDKNQAVVVYCSLGIRSEDIGEKLKVAGYTNVKNLYGGIFEWKNKGFEVYNSSEKSTDSVHAFSESWSKWLKKGIKVYPKS